MTRGIARCAHVTVAHLASTAAAARDVLAIAASLSFILVGGVLAGTALWFVVQVLS